MKRPPPSGVLIHDSSSQRNRIVWIASKVEVQAQKLKILEFINF